MKEYELYDWIGKWLVKKKECQQDEYSLGYTAEVQVADQWKLWCDLGRVDIFGLKYEIEKENRIQPVVHFHGYVVEVKIKEDGINEVLGKIIRDIKRLPKGELDKLYFYIAYPTEIVSDDIIATCKDYGIGVLKLRIVDNFRVYINELSQVCPEPRPWQAITNSAQKDAGLFHDALLNWNCLCQVIPQPVEFYNGLLRRD